MDRLVATDFGRVRCPAGAGVYVIASRRRIARAIGQEWKTVVDVRESVRLTGSCFYFSSVGGITPIGCSRICGSALDDDERAQIALRSGGGEVPALSAKRRSASVMTGDAFGARIGRMVRPVNCNSPATLWTVWR